MAYYSTAITNSISSRSRFPIMNPFSAELAIPGLSCTGLGMLSSRLTFEHFPLRLRLTSDYINICSDAACGSICRLLKWPKLSIIYFKWASNIQSSDEEWGSVHTITFPCGWIHDSNRHLITDESWLSHRNYTSLGNPEKGRIKIINGHSCILSCSIEDVVFVCFIAVSWAKFAHFYQYSVNVCYLVLSSHCGVWGGRSPAVTLLEFFPFGVTMYNPLISHSWICVSSACTFKLRSMHQRTVHGPFACPVCFFHTWVYNPVHCDEAFLDPCHPT